MVTMLGPSCPAYAGLNHDPNPHSLRTSFSWPSVRMSKLSNSLGQHGVRCPVQLPSTCSGQARGSLRRVPQRLHVGVLVSESCVLVGAGEEIYGGEEEGESDRRQEVTTGQIPCRMV